MTEKIFLPSLLLVTAAVACAAAPTTPAADQPVATFDGQAITEAELEAAAGPKLVQARQQIYDIKSQVLNELIFQKLLAMEAAKEGLTPEQFRSKHIDDAVQAPSDEEINQVLQQYRARLPADDAMARKQVVDFLTAQKRQAAAQQVRDQLMAEYHVQVHLTPPRQHIEITAADATRGPADAPVTLVEVSDFQCPYCAQTQSVLHQLDQIYGDEIRWVFKNLPLPMHPNARFAAQAAVCANEQGKFWPLHDWMFAHQSQLAPAQIEAEAGTLGIDVEAFKACVNAPATVQAVEKDMQAANALGINGTPAFVINGRLLVGAQPLQAFQQVIDDELRRAGVSPEPTPAQE